MKNLLILLAVGALLVGFMSSYGPVSAAPMFDDPQLCVNGKLLIVDPTTAPIDVFVQVGSNVTVDFNVANCGGDPSLPIVEAAQVTVGGKANDMIVSASTAPKAKVFVSYDRKSKEYKADKDGWVEVKFTVK